MVELTSHDVFSQNVCTPLLAVVPRMGEGLQWGKPAVSSFYYALVTRGKDWTNVSTVQMRS